MQSRIRINSAFTLRERRILLLCMEQKIHLLGESNIISLLFWKARSEHPTPNTHYFLLADV